MDGREDNVNEVFNMNQGSEADRIAMNLRSRFDKHGQEMLGKWKVERTSKLESA